MRKVPSLRKQNLPPIHSGHGPVPQPTGLLAFPVVAGCDDDCCDVVGVPNETTPATLEFTLGAAISFIDPPAHSAGLTAVGGISFFPG